MNYIVADNANQVAQYASDHGLLGLGPRGGNGYFVLLFTSSNIGLRGRVWVPGDEVIVLSQDSMKLWENEFIRIGRPRPEPEPPIAPYAMDWVRRSLERIERALR